MAIDIVFASGNAHKVAEVARILEGVEVRIAPLREYPRVIMPPEDGDTFQENALIKALAAYEGTGLWAVADDSGLEVDALGGAPGIHSARYSGEPVDYMRNNVKLLDELRAVPDEERTARFVSYVVFLCHAPLVDGMDDAPILDPPPRALPAGTVALGFRGTVEGRIIHELRGTDGFGYDPLFYVEPLEATFAEVPMDIKNMMSHRFNAFNAFKTFLGRALTPR